MTPLLTDTISSTSVSRNVELGFPSRRCGDWELSERIHTGPCAEVFWARPAVGPPSRSYDFCLKRLKPETAADGSKLRQFRREAILGHTLRHPHVISVLAAHVDRGPHYFVMPRLPGSTVRALLRDSGPVTIPVAIWIARQIADALSALHQRGWIHGDVQPGNIHVASNGHATLLDLGLATYVRTPRSRMRQWLIGTLAYVAPEQFTSSSAAGPPSDIYSLGIVLYEMICGRRPFASEDPGHTTESHLREVPPSIRTWAKNAPRCLAQCLSRMLSKDPTRRPSTDGELQAILARLEIETFGLRTIELIDDRHDPVLAVDSEAEPISRTCDQ
ncbi:MAG TPA: serine/threonine-protein kinase [Pirellulaceae bacterium]